LWLSTDSDPANNSLIASVPGRTHPWEWGKYSQQYKQCKMILGGQFL